MIWVCSALPDLLLLLLLMEILACLSFHNWCSKSIFKFSKQGAVPNLAMEFMVVGVEQYINYVLTSYLFIDATTEVHLRPPSLTLSCSVNRTDIKNGAQRGGGLSPLPFLKPSQEVLNLGTSRIPWPFFASYRFLCLHSNVH